ncbi:MAG: DUF58 domain-containing protein [Gemmatimonadaceae bacterium]
MHAEAATPALHGARFLDPKVLARIGDIEIIARTVVEGFIGGLHHSPNVGLSVDFAEHRSYMPGDDIRRIDWRLFGRTDRFHVKEFEADTNTDAIVLLDISRSMDYGSGSVTKLDYGRYLAACLAYLSRRQRDRVGLVTFDSEVRNVVPPSAKHLPAVLHAIERIKAGGGGGWGGPGNLERPLSSIAENIRRRSILILISDLYEEPERVAVAVRKLHGRGSDLIVLHVLDNAELQFPFEDAASFRDLESDEDLPVLPTELAERYRELVGNHVAELRRQLEDSRIDYALFDTSQPLDHALFEYLARRQRLARVR